MFGLNDNLAFISGMVVVNEMEKLAYSQKKIEKNPWLVEDDKQTVDTQVRLRSAVLVISILFYVPEQNSQ